MYRNYPENWGLGKIGGCAPWPQHRTATAQKLTNLSPLSENNTLWAIINVPFYFGL